MPESELDPTADDGFTNLSPEQESEISALLANLRDPAPVIPTDIAARIDAALAAEHLARAASAAPTSSESAATAASTSGDLATATSPTSAAPTTPGTSPATPAAAVTTSDSSADTTLAAVSSLANRAATSTTAKTGTRFPRSKTLFATAASIAALALLISRPWIHDSGSVVATGPTTNATNPSAQQRGVAATPQETLVQVSRHSYHRSSLAQDAAAFMSGQSFGNAVKASAAPKEWKGVTVCVQRTLSVLGASLSSKVDLGWLDGKPSAIVVISDSKAADPATQVRVLQEVNGKCTIAASTSLAR